jgi:hypothetical protein
MQPHYIKFDLEELAQQLGKHYAVGYDGGDGMQMKKISVFKQLLHLQIACGSLYNLILVIHVRGAFIKQTLVRQSLHMVKLLR